ncbi:MAG: DHH family phosphoesterase [Candidatus Thermoplasmatota archaeon]
MVKSLEKSSKKAAEKVLDKPKSERIRVISHYDADGITSAAIICKTLRREGYDFHCSLMRNPFYQGLERVKKEKNDLIIFTDMGSGQIEFIENMDSEAVILDHHQPIKEETNDDIIQVNAHLHGFNGNSEACGSTLAFSFAKAVDKNNFDLAPLALAGATGDKQYIGGISGFNEMVLKEAVEAEIVERYTDLKFVDKNLFDSLYYSFDPFFPGISGDEEAILELLEKLDLDKNSDVGSLDGKQRKKLRSYLMSNLVRNDVEKNILDTVIRERFYSDRIGFELEVFADILDSCGKSRNRGIGLSVCLGDKKSLDKALDVSKNFRERVLGELLELKTKGAKEKKSIRYFYSGGASIGGVVCGSAVNFIFDRRKPLICLRMMDDEIHVSCRGNHSLVEQGLDLGLAMKQAAEKVGGHGGGHNIAAGATVSADDKKKFLDLVDDIVFDQIK